MHKWICSDSLDEGGNLSVLMIVSFVANKHYTILLLFWHAGTAYFGVFVEVTFTHLGT